MLVVLNCFICLITVVSGLSENVEERSCINPPPVIAPNFDPDWAINQKKWYFIYGSKEGYYKLVEDLVKNNKTAFDELKEDALAKSSCMTAQWTKEKFIPTGLNGQIAEFKLNSPSKGTYIFKPEVGTGGYGEVTMTDLKSYIFFAECWDGNQEGWNVVSTNKNGVDKETEDKIYAHAKSLGFNEKYFFKLDHSQCADQMAASSEEEDELSLAASFNSYLYQGLESSDEISGEERLAEQLYYGGDLVSSED